MRVGSVRVRRAPSWPASACGYGLVVVLILVALSALGLASVGQSWAQTAQREREQELLRIGQLYAQALTRYRDMSPGSVKQLPRELEDLLQDRRFAGMVRHLRQLYPDPLSADGRWALVRGDDGSIQGVRSQSTDTPLASGGVRRPGLELPAVSHYSDWKFLAETPK
jgi:type II secretory pathway pseudopilin PulG